MKKHLFYLLCVVALGTVQRIMADAVVVTYLELPPKEAMSVIEEGLEPHKVVQALESYVDKQLPSKIATKAAQGSLRKDGVLQQSGFLALYGGYSDYSDNDGRIAFPLRHTTPKLYLVITPKIKLETIKGNTVSHPTFALDKGAPVKMYLFEKKQDNHKNYFWHVSEQPVPPDYKINPISMVILTNPANIYVPLGDFMANDSPQMTLPSLYVVGLQGNDRSVLAALDMMYNFEPVTTSLQKAGEVKNQNLLTNN